MSYAMIRIALSIARCDSEDSAVAWLVAHGVTKEEAEKIRGKK